jgi:ribonuclease HI
LWEGILFLVSQGSEHGENGMNIDLPQVTIYTDGACLGNPGPGGFGVVILEGSQRRELSGGYSRTTNNRMELRAAIEGLRALDQASTVMLYSDSRYLVDAINLGWLRGWKARNWKKSDKTRALNVDLWKQILELIGQHKVKFVWVEGHAGVPENERCDQLSVAAATRKGNPVDPGYEAANGGQTALFD